jgi:hypothetical protein
MKKYKLIKEYPGSPKLNSEVINKNPKHPNWYYLHIACMSIIDNPENYPEFWEEVVEKDYEIISFKLVDRLYKICSDGCLLWDCEEYKSIDKNPGATHWTEAISKGYIIHSVKRLSDGEVFTVGDVVVDKLYNIKRKIEGFDIFKTLYTSEIFRFKFKSSVVIEITDSFCKVKQPLFKTKDGVDIYESDEYYFVSIDYTEIVSPHKDSIYFNEYINRLKCFSTKEKAEEYILMNKPCLSISDLTEIENFDLTCFYTNKLIKLVKSKLKNG